MTEETLNAGIADYEGSGLFTDREQAVLRFVDLLNDRHDQIGEADYARLREYLSDDEIAELFIYLVLNLGMHIVFSTLDFYPMFDPDGNIVSQEESRRIYGEVPAPITSGPTRKED